jgi:hypothetical protein
VTRARGVARMCAAIVAVVMGTASASASTEYPPEMQRHMALDQVPRCALCHAGAADAGDVDGGAVDTPFARSMITRGLRGGADLGSLDTALDALKKDRVDSDGDGAIDVDEIAYGGDPNVANLPEGGAQSSPAYGCSLARGGGEGSERKGKSALAILAALVIAVAYAWRPSRLAIGPASLSSSPRRRHDSNVTS